MANRDREKHTLNILVGHSGEKRILKELETIDEAAQGFPNAIFQIGSTPEQLAFLLSSRQPDVALFVLDDVFNMEAVKQIAHQNPELKIVLIARDEQFAMDAFRIHALDYLISPISPEDLKNLFSHVEPTPQSPLLSVKCFGAFEVFSDHRPMRFHRSKSKEMFAYMVSNCGASSNTAELCGVLFEDSGSLEKKRSYFRNIVVDLKRSFGELGLESVLVFSHNSFAVDPDLFQCDYYEFLEDGSEHRDRYPEGFMKQYSWAEEMVQQEILLWPDSDRMFKEI